MLVGLITTAFAAAPATKVLLDATKYPTARCLDGSMGAFYFSPATTASGRSKFYLHQEGGGGCNSVSDCAERSFSALGSSSPLYGWRSTYDLSHYEVFSRSEAESPLLHVIEWVEGEAPAVGAYSLATSYPARILREADHGATLESLGLGGGGTLFLQEEDDDEGQDQRCRASPFTLGSR